MEPIFEEIMREYMSTRDAAAYLGISHQWIEIGRSKGYGPRLLNWVRVGEHLFGTRKMNLIIGCFQDK